MSRSGADDLVHRVAAIAGSPGVSRSAISARNVCFCAGCRLAQCRQDNVRLGLSPETGRGKVGRGVRAVRAKCPTTLSERCCWVARPERSSPSGASCDRIPRPQPCKRGRHRDYSFRTPYLAAKTGFGAPEFLRSSPDPSSTVPNRSRGPRLLPLTWARVPFGAMAASGDDHATGHFISAARTRMLRVLMLHRMRRHKAFFDRQRPWGVISSWSTCRTCIRATCISLIHNRLGL